MNTPKTHANSSSSSKKTNKFLLATALAGVLMTASCADESKKEELNFGTNAQKELVDKNKTNTPENTVSNSGNNTNEEVNIDPESLAFFDEYENEEIAQLEKEHIENQKKIAELDQKIEKLNQMAQILKSKNQQRIKDVEALFNDPMINENNLNDDAEFRKAFCGVYWAYEENIKEHPNLQKSQRAKELEPLYNKFKNK